MYNTKPPEPPCEFEPIPADQSFKLETVIICNDYSDFLCWTLPHNKQFFERTVVVTSPRDKETQRLCTFYHVQCIVSDRLLAGGKFHKGAAINDGLAQLRMDGWVLHLDADIWLPPQTRLLLQQANLDKSMLYGIDRFGVRGFKTWMNFLAKPALQHESYAYIQLANSGLPVLTRVMQAHMEGYLPIGFFQLWHPGTSGVFRYPEEESSAAHGDLRFARQWRRAKRSLIPEIIGYHLESEDAEFGTNWHGRKTKPFIHED